MRMRLAASAAAFPVLRDNEPGASFSPLAGECQCLACGVCPVGADGREAGVSAAHLDRQPVCSDGR